MKRECAEAALNMVRANMTIGLSEGRMIEYLIEFLQYAKHDVKIVTSSMNTALLCRKHELSVLPTWMAEKVDIAFDECDQVDTDLNGLKTASNLKVQDKIIAQMADKYVLMVDAANFVDEFTFEFPVAVEVIPDAFSYVISQIENMGASVTWKSATKGDAVYTNHGNIVLECIFSKIDDVKSLNDQLMLIPGVVDTSLYIGIATNAIVGSDEEVKVINKEENEKK